MVLNHINNFHFKFVNFIKAKTKYFAQILIRLGWEPASTKYILCNHSVPATIDFIET